MTLAQDFTTAIQSVTTALTNFNSQLVSLETTYSNLPNSPPSSPTNQAWKDAINALSSKFVTLFNTVVCSPSSYPNSYYSLLRTYNYITDLNVIAIYTTGDLLHLGGQSGFYTRHTSYLSSALTSPATVPLLSTTNNYKKFKQNMLDFITGYITGTDPPTGFPNQSDWDSHVSFPINQITPSCFNTGTLILCLINNQEQYIPIENMREGTLVKTIHNGYLKVDLIGKKTIINDPTDFRRCMYIMPTTNLIITGGHSILVDDITDDERNTLLAIDHIHKIEGKYLLLAAATSKFERLTNTNKYTYYHFVLQSDDPTQRFGVWANGILTETTFRESFLGIKCDCIS